MKKGLNHAPEITQLMWSFSPWILLSAVSGITAGAATVTLLDTINHVLHHPEGLTVNLLLTFTALSVLVLIGRVVSDMSANLVGQRLVAKIRKTLARKILGAPIDVLERNRTYRLMPILTQDVDMISDVAFTLASTTIALAITLGCLGYLAWLSPSLFALLMVALILGTMVQALAQAKGVAGFWKARDLEEILHKGYRGISEGAKELRMHRARRTSVRNQIDLTVDSIRDIHHNAINTYVMATAFGSALFFLLIALVLGWATIQHTEPETISGFVLVLLFLKGPIEQIIDALPGIGRAKVALNRINELSIRFTNSEAHLNLESVPSIIPFQENIELRGVQYIFDAPEDGKGFVLGPIDLTLKPGELVFVVGNNGSGKTTLIKLLLGLYVPQEGEVILDGKTIAAENRDEYRQLFTTVFADFYLFEDLVSDELEKTHVLPEMALPYLQRLEIAHKVLVKDGTFSTIDLSTGQRKRLALVHAYLEGRPVLVFDEWAADQDPTFRHLFYTELLPELRAKGHLLIVISHDDRYFHVADRVVHMEAGRIIDN
ncbi:MAG: cyclic peptide export ABC transporter [Nitrosomonas sp.]|nr:MAG: cyclic peptide export ABC transporter [Nitrosomonas sp.]